MFEHNFLFLNKEIFLLAKIYQAALNVFRRLDKKSSAYNDNIRGKNRFPKIIKYYDCNIYNLVFVKFDSSLKNNFLYPN